MKHIKIACALILASASTSVQSQTELTPDQKGYIIYDRCIMQAAIQASHTEANDDEIFGLAKQQCAATRASVIIGQENNKQFLAALDAADSDKAANFPSWIKGVRARRHAREASATTPRSPQ